MKLATHHARRLSCTCAALLLAAGCQRGGGHEQRRTAVGPRAFAGDLLPPPAAQGAPVDGGRVVVAMNAEPPSLNYQLDPLDAWGKKINELVMESLARPHPTTWVHEPRLAESWTISADQRTLTFKLRRDVRWHDGEPFDADDVIFTFDTILAPSSKTIAIRSYLQPLSGYTKSDAYTVVFTLREPYRYAFDAIAELFIYPRHIYARGDFNTHPANRAPIGTGRYRFVHWRTGDEILLRRNDAYVGPRAALDELVLRYVPNATVRGELLRRGELDVIEKLSPEEWRQLTTDQEIATRFWRLRHVPNSLQWIGWNQERVFFRDRRVRQALTMLLDRQDIVDNLRLGLDDPAVSWFYPGTPEYDRTTPPWPYAPERARALLDEAGWRDRDGDGLRDRDGAPFRFTFIYPAGPPFYEQLASLMAADFQRAGIRVDTTRVEWAVYTERLRRHEFDACALLWEFTPRNDPIQVWHSREIDGGSNFVAFRNAEADRLLEEARRELDDARRIELYHRFNRILHQEQPYTFLFNRNNLSLVSRRLGGIVSTPYGVLSYGDLYRVADPAP